MLINKPFEELTGSNYGIVRQKCGRIHVMTRKTEVVRQVIDGCRNWNDMPREIKRGLIKLTIETMAEYRGTYVSVMTGRF